MDSRWRQFVGDNRENRISKGTVAIQVNKWYPILNWQLKHHRVCLVMNQ